MSALTGAKRSNGFGSWQPRGNVVEAVDLEASYRMRRAENDQADAIAVGRFAKAIGDDCGNLAPDVLKVNGVASAIAYRSSQERRRARFVGG